MNGAMYREMYGRAAVGQGPKLRAHLGVTNAPPATAPLSLSALYNDAEVVNSYQDCPDGCYRLFEGLGVENFWVELAVVEPEAQLSTSKLVLEVSTSVE